MARMTREKDEFEYRIGCGDQYSCKDFIAAALEGTDAKDCDFSCNCNHCPFMAYIINRLAIYEDAVDAFKDAVAAGQFII